MNIYVGNLSLEVAEDDLRTAFEGFGVVESVNLIKDKISGVSKGFAFIVIESGAEAQAAIDDLNDSELKGSKIVVNEARARSKQGRRSGGKKGRDRRN